MIPKSIKMVCSHCQSYLHNISTCLTNKKDILLSILNRDVDPYIARRKNLIRAGLPFDWFRDENDKLPSDPDYLISCNPNRSGIPLHFPYKQTTMIYDELLNYIQNNIILCTLLKNGTKIFDQILFIDPKNQHEYFQDAFYITYNSTLKIFQSTEKSHRIRLPQVEEYYDEADNFIKKVKKEFLFVPEENRARIKIQMRQQRANRREEQRLLLLQQEHEEEQREFRIQEEYKQNLLKEYHDKVSNLKNNLKKSPIETCECPICMENLGESNKMILRCGHQLCGDCTFRHFQSKGGLKCPMCREELFIPIPEELM